MMPSNPQYLAVDRYPASAPYFMKWRILPKIYPGMTKRHDFDRFDQPRRGGVPSADDLPQLAFEVYPFGPGLGIEIPVRFCAPLYHAPVLRLQAFEPKPCDESSMNYWMSAVRVGRNAAGFLINGLKRDSMILHELFFDGLGEQSEPATCSKSNHA
jgi:hypothetical protein